MKKERQQIDDFFREALGDHIIPPSDQAKKAFLKDAESLARRSPSRWWYLGLSLAIILMSAGAFLFFSSRDETIPIEKEIPGSSKKQQTSQSIQTIKKSTAINNNEPTFNHETRRSLSIAPNTNLIRRNAKKNKATTGSIILSESQSLTGNNNKNPSPGIVAASQVALVDLGPAVSEKTEVTPVAGDSSLITDTVINVPPTKVPPDSARAPVPLPPQKTSKQAGNSEWRLGAGISFSPEWMFGTIEEPTFVNNFSIEGLFRFGRYSLRTGAGISLSKGTNQLMVEYNDYLGNYMKLDSMTFAWDERHYYLLPTYYLTNKEVYDSLMKLEDSKIVKRYTYLQIPIVFGYDFIIKEKMSFGLRAGPIISILLKEKTLSEPYDPGRKKIISINEITPGQASLNWQVMVGLNATFRLSKRVGMEVEPFGKYYFNSVHETPSGSGKPWSVGLRAAFFISFQK